MDSDNATEGKMLAASNQEPGINEDTATTKTKEVIHEDTWTAKEEETVQTASISKEAASTEVINEALSKLSKDLEEIKTQIKIKKGRLAEAILKEELERASDIKIMLDGLKASEVNLQDKVDALGGGLSNITPQKDNLNPRSPPVSESKDGSSPSSSDTRSESLDPDDPSVINTESAEAEQEGVPLVERIKLQYRTPDGHLKERYKRRAHTDLFYWDTEVMPKSEYVRRKFLKGHLAETMYNFSIDTHTPVAITWIDPCTDVVHYAGAGECLDFLNIPEDRAVEWQPPNHPQSGKMSSEFCRSLPFNRVEKPRKKGALTSQVKQQWKISDLSSGVSKRREAAEPSEEPLKKISKPSNKNLTKLSKKNLTKPSKKNLTKKPVVPKNPAIVPCDPNVVPDVPKDVPDLLNNVQDDPTPIPNDPTSATDKPTSLSENARSETEEDADESVTFTPAYRKSREKEQRSSEKLREAKEQRSSGAKSRGLRGGAGRGIARGSSSQKVRGGAAKGKTTERGARGVRGVRGGQGRGRASHTNETPATRPTFNPPTIGNKEPIQLFGLFKTASNTSDNEP